MNRTNDLTKSRILLLDDHPILTDGLKMLFKDNTRYMITEAFQSCHYAISYMKAGNAVDLAIIDYSMPDMLGIEFVKRSKELFPELKIIVLSVHDECTIIRELIEAGVDGYVLKKCASEELVFAVDRVLSGQSYWSAEAGQKLFQRTRYGETKEEILTDREKEVLRLIAREFTNKQIASELCISERTVEVHRKNMMRKKKCNSTVGLIKYALQHNLV